MYKIKRSMLFKRQFVEHVKNYKKRANTEIANNFINCIEHSIKFIAKNPQACSIYIQIQGKNFKKWSVKDFPYSIFFRIEKNAVILEILYAHRMNILKRIKSDT